MGKNQLERLYGKKFIREIVWGFLMYYKDLYGKNGHLREMYGITYPETN